MAGPPLHLHRRRGVDLDPRILAGALQHPGGGDARDLGEIELLRRAARIGGEAAKAVDDVGHPLRPLQSAVDRLPQPLHRAVQPQFAAQAHQLRPLRPVAHALEVGLQFFQILGDRMHIAVHEADRIVQLMGDAGDQAAERSHLLGLHQGALRRLQLLMGLFEIAIGAAQLADRPADQHEAQQAPPLIAPRRDLQLHRRAVDQRQLQRRALRSRGGRQGRGERRAIRLGDQRLQRRLRQRGFRQRLALRRREPAQGGVGALHPPVPVADDQRVAHGAEHRLHKGAHRLQIGVLGLQRRLMADQLRIGGVHLAHHLAPGVVGHGSRAEGGGVLRRHGRSLGAVASPGKRRPTRFASRRRRRADKRRRISRAAAADPGCWDTPATSAARRCGRAPACGRNRRSAPGDGSPPPGR